MKLTEKILNHCNDVFFRLGIKSVSMDDISKDLGISKKTLYSCFCNKKMLVRDTLVEFVKTDEEKILKIVENSKDAIDEMIEITRHVAQFFRSLSPSTIHDLKKYHREVWNMIEKEHFHFIFNVIKNNIERGIKEGFYRKETDADIIARLYVQKSHSITDEQVFPLSKYNRVELLKEHMIYHLNGITNSEGEKHLKSIDI